MSKSPKQKREKRSLLWRLVLWSVVLLLVVGLASAGYAYYWVNDYIKSDAFREMVARQLGQASGTKVSLTSLELFGPNVHVSELELKPRKRETWTRLDAEKLKVEMDWSHIRERLVRVPEVSLKSLRLELRDDAAPDDLPMDLDQDIEVWQAPEWLKKWMPNRTEIGVVATESFSIKPPPTGGIALEGMALDAKPSESGGAPWNLHGKGGALTLPGLVPFAFDQVNATLNETALIFHDASAEWYPGCTVTTTGEMPFGKDEAWQFSGNFRDLDVHHFLDEGMADKVQGTMQGAYKANAKSVSGQVSVHGGVLKNMAVLDRVASVTRMAAFRRLDLSQVEANIARSGREVRITKLAMQSNNLIRVEGNVTITGKSLDGTLYIGVTPEALNWLPGARSRVFNESRSGGFAWATMNISGTVDNVNEDLSQRLKSAVGQAILFDGPLKAVDLGFGVLQTGGKAATGTVGAGKGIIEGTGKAAGKILKPGKTLLERIIPGGR